MASIYLQKNPGNAAFRGTTSRWAKRLQLAALMIATGLVSGCASIFGHETETLPITSNPADAQILITDEAGYTVYRGRTPDKVPLPKSDGRYFGGKTFSIAISKKGYVTQRVKIDAQPNALYLGGNILAGGLIGWLVIDPTNGKMYELSKAGVDVTLQKRPDQAAETGAATSPPPSPSATAKVSATPATSTASSAADLRPTTTLSPAVAATAAAPATPEARPDTPPPAISPASTAAPAAAVIPSSAPPSIFVPERPAPVVPPPEPAVEASVVTAPAAEQPAPPPTAEASSPPEPPASAPPPAVESRPPPPYWPAPPKLPVSPSTRAPGVPLLAAA